MILGLDISTTCTGYCIVNNETKEIVDKGAFILEGELFERIDMLWKELENLLSIHDIDFVNVEDFLMKFAIGRSSAFVINKLIAFNSIISFLLYGEGLTIRRHNVKSARKRLFGMASNKMYKNAKEFVVARLKIKLGQEFYDSLPRTKRDNLAKESYDICDAVVMALQ